MSKYDTLVWDNSALCFLFPSYPLFRCSLHLFLFRFPFIFILVFFPFFCFGYHPHSLHNWQNRKSSRNNSASQADYAKTPKSPQMGPPGPGAPFKPVPPPKPKNYRPPTNGGSNGNGGAAMHSSQWENGVSLEESREGGQFLGVVTFDGFHRNQYRPGRPTVSTTHQPRPTTTSPASRTCRARRTPIIWASVAIMPKCRPTASTVVRAMGMAMAADRHRMRRICRGVATQTVITVTWAIRAIMLRVAQAAWVSHAWHFQNFRS
jgi:hypothetical protein